MAAAAGQATSPAGGGKPLAGEQREAGGTRAEPPGSKSFGLEASASEESRWRPVLGLVCEMSVDLPLPNIKVADFLQLKAGSVMVTDWRLSRDVPLRVNGTLIAWAEFEGSGGRLAVRITEVA